MKKIGKKWYRIEKLTEKEKVRLGISIEVQPPKKVENKKPQKKEVEK